MKPLLLSVLTLLAMAAITSSAIADCGCSAPYAASYATYYAPAATYSTYYAPAPAYTTYYAPAYTSYYAPAYSTYYAPAYTSYSVRRPIVTGYRYYSYSPVVYYGW